jgi:microcystin-dependent protein
MANFRHTGAGNGVARSDYAALGQVQDNIVKWAVAVGTPDAITATLAPPISALADGQLIYLRAAAANTTVAPTFGPNGLAVRPITRAGGGPLNAGDIPGPLAEIILRYNAANTRWELLNPATNAWNIPPGTEVHYAGIQAPSGWYLAFGQAASRTSDLALFNALTITTTGSTHSSTTIDNLGLDLRGAGIEGGVVEGAGIPLGTTLVSLTATSLTLSQAAISTGTGIPIRILPFGQGDGSTTFNLPDRRGRALFGRDNMGGVPANRLTNNSFGAQGIIGSQLAGAGGEQSHTQVTQEMAVHTHADTHSHGYTEPNSGTGHAHGITTTGGGGTGGTFTGGVGGGASAATNNATTGIAISNASGFLGNAGGQTGVTQAMNNMPPGGVSNVIIKR